MYYIKMGSGQWQSEDLSKTPGQTPHIRTNPVRGVNLLNPTSQIYALETVTQTNRQNHFTVIELWGDRKAADAHSTAAHTRAYRDKLGPASGALYDERLYKTLD